MDLPLPRKQRRRQSPYSLGFMIMSLLRRLRLPPRFRQLNRADPRDRHPRPSLRLRPLRHRSQRLRLSLDREQLAVVAAAEVVADLVSGQQRLRSHPRLRQSRPQLSRLPRNQRWPGSYRLMLRRLRRFQARLYRDRLCRAGLCRIRWWRARPRPLEWRRLPPAPARER